MYKNQRDHRVLVRSLKEGAQRWRSLCKKDRRFVCTKIVWNIANLNWGARFLEIVVKLVERRKCYSSIECSGLIGHLFRAQRRAHDNTFKHIGSKTFDCNERLQWMGRSLHSWYAFKLHPLRPTINIKYHGKSLGPTCAYEFSSLPFSHSTHYQVHGLSFESRINSYLQQ